MAIDKDKLDRHIKQWLHNRTLIGQIPQSHSDWIVTVAFYAAVHAIDAALAAESVSVCSHDTRFEAIARLNRMKKIGLLYHPLYSLSRTVRYTADPTAWIPPGEIERKVLRAYLLPLEHSVVTLINRSVMLPTINLMPATSPSS